MRQLAALILGLGLASGLAAAQDTPEPEVSGFFVLAGGDVGGTYFAIARALCREANRIGSGAFRCSPEATPGSVYNLTGIHRGELDFAIVQSDWLQAARAGTDRFAALGPFEPLRGVSELYREAITVLVGADADIPDLGALDGRRVDIGPAASGRRATIERIFRALAFGRSRLALISELPASAAVDQLCAGRLDAVILVVGHPDTNVARALDECGARILPLAGTEQGAAIAALGDYFPETIDAGIYPSLTEPVGTLGVMAALVTRDAVPPEQVTAMLYVLRSREEVLIEAAPVMAARGTAPVWSGLGQVPVHPAAAPTQ